MTLAYVPRLICVALASFFLVHLAIGLIAASFTPVAIRATGRGSAKMGARCLLLLRFLPVGFAGFVVGALCVPSYLRFEENFAGEQVGILCVSAAALAVLLLAISLIRALGALARYVGYMRHCERDGRQVQIPGDISPVWVIEDPHTAIGLVGSFRPRVVVSQRILNNLSVEELGAAVRHERAHEHSHDNLKRLLLFSLPDVLPFIRIFGALERAWHRRAEWAADDEVAARGSRETLSLAAALVQVARLTSSPQLRIVTSLLTDGSELSARVDRLLASQDARTGRKRGLAIPILRTAVIVSAVLISAALQPSTSFFIHCVLERLMH